MVKENMNTSLHIMILLMVYFLAVAILSSFESNTQEYVQVSINTNEYVLDENEQEQVSEFISAIQSENWR